MSIIHVGHIKNSVLGRFGDLSDYPTAYPASLFKNLTKCRDNRNYNIGSLIERLVRSTRAIPTPCSLIAGYRPSARCLASNNRVVVQPGA